MKITQLAENFAISPQIEIQDIADIKAMGFDGIVCNRPNGEEREQPLFDELMFEAEKLGLDIIAIPMSGPQVSLPMVTEFNEFMQSHHHVLGFCRTGNRSSILWNTAQTVKH